jgi:putative ABC transport system permease protein
MRQALTFWFRHKASFASLVAVLSVAIGVVTAVWSIASAIWWQPLPFPSPDRVASIGFTGWNGDTGRADRTSIADYVDVRERQRAFAAAAAYEDVNDLFLPSPDGPVSLNAVGATASLFDVLRVAPILGRTFTPADGQPNAPPVAVITESLWRSQFAGDPAILDRQVALVSRAGNADRRVLIVGVLPTDVPYGADKPPASLIVAVPDAPLGFEPLRGRLANRTPIGRLADGVSMAAATDQTTLVLREVDRDSPSPGRLHERAASLIPLRELLYGSTRGLPFDARARPLSWPDAIECA